jgi:hypothetical protein
MGTEPVDPHKGEVSPPIQYSVVPEKKRRRRYSRNARPLQTFERRISKSAHRVSKAISKGIQVYLDERDESLRRRRDGAIIESYVNVATGISEGIADASPVITDVAKAINSKRTRRLLRSFVRAIPRFY